MYWELRKLGTTSIITDGKKVFYTRKPTPSQKGQWEDHIINPKELTPFHHSLEGFQTKLTFFAKIIRENIANGKDIILRYHFDADGICSALPLEKAMTKFAKKLGYQKPFLNLSPMKSPEYTLSEFLFDTKADLIILTDISPSKESILKLAKELKKEFLIIDHHIIKDFLKEYSSLLNSRTNGSEGEITAGMLSYELARYIDSELNEPHFPIISATGDKSPYGSKEYIKKASALDYAAYHLRNRHEKILNKIIEEENISNILANESEELLEKKSKEIPLEKKGEILIADLTNLKQGYPPPGKLTSYIHQKEKSKITLGILNDLIIFRSEIDLKEKVKELCGAGHGKAGTLPPDKEKTINLLSLSLQE